MKSMVLDSNLQRKSEAHFGVVSWWVLDITNTCCLESDKQTFTFSDSRLV